MATILSDMNIKKITFLILTVSLVLLCISCSSPKSYLEKGESSYADNLSFFDYGHRIAETESGYFILATNFLHYLDKESEECVVFSNDPISTSELYALENNFKHEAFFGGAKCVYFQDDFLYSVVFSGKSDGKSHIIQLDPKTHQRKVLSEINTENTYFILLEDKILMLKPKIEFIEEGGSHENMSAYKTTYEIIGYDLKNNSSIEPIEIPLIEKYAKYGQMVPNLRGINNKFQMIFSYHIPQTESADIDAGSGSRYTGIDGEEYTYLRFMFEYDIKSGEFKQVNMNDGERNLAQIAYLDGDYYLSEGSILTEEQLAAGKTYERWCLKIDSDFENEEHFFDLEDTNVIKSNGHSLYQTPGSIIDYDELADTYSVKPFTIKKLIDRDWQEIVKLETSSALDSVYTYCLGISSTDDVFIYDFSGFEIYLIRDNKVIKIIDIMAEQEKYINK